MKNKVTGCVKNNRYVSIQRNVCQIKCIWFVIELQMPENTNFGICCFYTQIRNSHLFQANVGSFLLIYGPSIAFSI